MAQFNFNENAIPDLIKSLEGANLFDDDVAQEMLFEGGEILTDEVKRQAALADHSRTGTMIKKIGFTHKVKKGKNGNNYIVVTPKGKDANGVRNATKAFVLNYGRDRRYGEIKASYFWTKAKKKAEPKMTQKCEEIATKKLKSKGLI